MKTYCSGNDEAREKVPYSVESRGNDGSNVVIRCNCHSHHPIESEVQEGEVHEEEVPKELANCPIKSNHGVYYNSIYDGLDKNVW